MCIFYCLFKITFINHHFFIIKNTLKIVKQHLKSPEAERTNFKRGVSKEQTFKNIADTVE